MKEMIIKHRAKIFAVIVLLQVVAIGVLYASRLYTLASGVEVKLRTVPVDPRDIIRGQYVDLRYDISTLSFWDFNSSEQPKAGDTVYVRLVKGYDDFWSVAGVTLSRPMDYGVYLEGRIIADDAFMGGMKLEPTWRVEYGIEKYFVDEANAKDLERSGRLAVIAAVDRNGKAVIKRVESLGEEEIIDIPPAVTGSGVTQPRPAGPNQPTKPTTSTQTQIQARDAERVSELKQLRLALQVYAADHGGTYPSSLSVLAPQYIPAVPTDPTSHTWYNYESKVNLGNTTYTLSGWLEDPKNPALQMDAIPGDLKYDVRP